MINLARIGSLAVRPRSLAFSVLVLVWGALAIVTQSLLLREALVLMYGSEFAWSVVLFAWLFGVASGAAIGGWVARRIEGADVALAVVLVVLGAAACVELWVFRGARGWLGVGAGELLPLPRIALAAMLFVSPVSALVGLAFPLACCVRLDEAVAGPERIGDVYALESAGSLLGGAVFSFWAVEHLAPIETSLLLAGLTAVAAAGLLIRTRPRATTGVGFLVLGLGAVVLCVVRGDALNERLILRRWQDVAPGYELVAEAETKYQNLAVGRLAEQYTLYSDGHVATDFPDPYTFVPLAHLWMCQHPSPRRVLVLGGGAEGLLAEILRHPVEGVDYVEPDPRQIELIEPHLAEPDRRALADERVTVHHRDARFYVKTQRACFDLVIARLPEPTSALRARYYTREFFAELRRAMSPASVLCMTVAAAPADLPSGSAGYLASVRASLRTAFPEVLVGWGDPAHVLAATQARLIATDPGELTRRYEEGNVVAELFDPLWFAYATDWFDPQKIATRARQLDAVAGFAVSTDLHPVVYVQRLELWEQMIGGPSGGVIGWLRSVRVGHLAIVLAAAGLLTLGVFRLRRRGAGGWSDGAVVLSMGTTGFATMALSIVWLFAFQHLYGYVYQRIGWIIALFMGGLVAGCGLANWRARRRATAGQTAHLRRLLVGVDVLIAATAAGVPLLLPALGRMQGTEAALVVVEWVVSILVALTGVLGGAAFALAGRLAAATTAGTAQAASRVDSADHAGACLGALLTGILLVPVYGTTTAAMLLSGVKLGSAAVLLLAGPARTEPRA